MPLRINIVTQNQERIRLEADRRETFLTLKKLIRVIKGYPIDTQDIYLNGIKLLDDDRISDLTDGQSLDLKISL